MGITHPDPPTARLADADELLTSSDVARINQVVPDTVRLWERSGKISPAFRTPSGINLYRRENAERIARDRIDRRSAR